MNKVLHAFVYVILVVALVALFFEKNLFEKRTLLGDRNRALEDFIVKIARTIEKEDAKKPLNAPEAKKDISPVEAKAVDNPEQEDLLEGYAVQREQQNLDTFNFENSKDRIQLRQLYLVGADGNVVLDPANYNKPATTGAGTMAELLDKLFERAKAQQANLNMTRDMLTKERAKLEALVADYNKLKPEMRQDKITMEEFKAKLTAIEQEKTSHEEEKTKLKGQIDDLKAEVTSLKDEASSAKDETEAVKEDLAKSEKKIAELTALLQQQAQTAAPATAQTAGSVSATSVKAGVKGEISDVDNRLMFCVIRFSDDAIRELLGADRNGALPQLEFAVRRDKTFVGRVRLRQAVADKNYVIADLLGDWKQCDVQKGDAIYAE